MDVETTAARNHAHAGAFFNVNPTPFTTSHPYVTRAGIFLRDPFRLPIHTHMLRVRGTDTADEEDIRLIIRPRLGELLAYFEALIRRYASYLRANDILSACNLPNQHGHRVALAMIKAEHQRRELEELLAALYAYEIRGSVPQRPLEHYGAALWLFDYADVPTEEWWVEFGDDVREVTRTIGLVVQLETK